jgi:hypothetical protein
MRPTLQLIWAMAACASLALAGCGGDDPGPAPPSGEATSADYVAAVEELLAPAAALAALAGDRLAGEGTRSGSAQRLVDEAEGELDDLQELELGDAGLEAQRARVVRAFGPVLARMRAVTRDLGANDLPGLRRSGPRLFEVIKELPSATSA